MLGLTPAYVRASWFTAKPAGQDAGAEVKIRAVSPWDDRKVTLRWSIAGKLSGQVCILDSKAQTLVQQEVFVTGLYLQLEDGSTAAVTFGCFNRLLWSSISGQIMCNLYTGGMVSQRQVPVFL